MTQGSIAHTALDVAWFVAFFAWIALYVPWRRIAVRKSEADDDAGR